MTIRDFLVGRGYELAGVDLTISDRFTQGGCVVIDAATALWEECQRLQAELNEARAGK